MFAKIKDGKVVQVPYGFGDLLKENPSSAFPNDDLETLFPLTDAATKEGYQLVKCKFFVNNDVDRFNFIEGDIEAVKENGEWVARYKLVPLTAEQKEEYLTNQANVMRGQRNMLLAQSDWTQLADATVDKQAWATYRQALRDVPSQSGFPKDVAWPVKP